MNRVLTGNEMGLKPISGHGRATRRAIVAATIGNTLEWYDFAVFGFFAATISKLFFPTGNGTASLLLTLGTFGVGFFMRPVGALVLGSIADRKGRKAALSMTILMMAAGTALIGFAPTYASAGVWAPIMIVVARLLQGFSCGGEIGGATAFLAEHAPPAKRGYYASWLQASQAAALLIGSLFGAVLSGLLTPDQLESWGWRVPFLFGLLIGPIGFYIRSSIDESPLYLEQKEQISTPIRDAFRFHGSSLITGLGITVTWTVCTYIFLIYMPSYSVRQLGFDRTASFTANAAGLAVLLVLVPIFGRLSDRIGRRPLLLGAASLIFLAAYPVLYGLSAHPTFGVLLAAQITFGVLIAALTGPAPAAMADLFPVSVRSSGLSVAYNFAVTIFGGFAPFIATFLIQVTGSGLAPAGYVMFAAVLTVGVLTFLKAPNYGLRVGVCTIC
jgi:MHS family proline/betaine transporter-like MFS transporter